MKLEDIQRANKLVDLLVQAIDEQRAAITAIEKSLNDYVDFMQNSIKETRE